MRDKLTNEAIELLRLMIGTPSPSYGETEVCSLIQGHCKSWGLESKRIGNNLIFSHLKGKQGSPVLALTAHIDTVPAASSYTRDPLDPGNDEDIIWGLGSNDDGGSVVAMIATFRHFVESDAELNLILTLTCEEERSGDGGAALIYGPDGPFATGELPQPDAVIVGEPTGMRAASSERGLIVIDAEARGVSGHAARNEGVNALYIALEDIQRLRQHSFSRRSAITGEVRLNVTQINAGSVHNVIPDRCSFVIDVRPNESYLNSEILDDLQSLCRSTLKARNLDHKSSATKADGRLASCIVKAGLQCYSSPTTSDWISIPYDAVKLGPGDSVRSHKADEYILASEIAEAVDKYQQFIQLFCYGDSLE